MQNGTEISTSRIEAFSDGVIAIIITIMVFDLKVGTIIDEVDLIIELAKVFPKVLSYIVSFLMISIMWVNHHQLFHQIKTTDRNLLWLNIFLLFSMSLIPFGTNLIGANPFLWESSFFYGIIFFLNALAFTFLRNYAIKKGLLHETILVSNHIKRRNMNILALIIYLLSAIAGIFSVYISFVLFLVVPIMYFIPEKIIHENK